MTVKLHFEKLSPGLHAKLDAKYRASAKQCQKDPAAAALKKLYGNGCGINLVMDTIKLPQNRVR